MSYKAKTVQTLFINCPICGCEQDHRCIDLEPGKGVLVCQYCGESFKWFEETLYTTEVIKP